MMHPTANIWGDSVIGDGTKVGAFCDIGGAYIGLDCKVQCHVSISPGTVIGDRVFIGPGARFANDRYPDLSTANFEPSGAIVEDDVVIGMGALIGPGVRIGKGAFIGMGAVVIRDVPDNTTVIGNPARPIGHPV